MKLFRDAVLRQQQREPHLLQRHTNKLGPERHCSWPKAIKRLIKAGAPAHPDRPAAAQLTVMKLIFPIFASLMLQYQVNTGNGDSMLMSGCCKEAEIGLPRTRGSQRHAER